MEIRIEVNSNDILNSVTGLCVKFAHTNTHTHNLKFLTEVNYGLYVCVSIRPFLFNYILRYLGFAAC